MPSCLGIYIEKNIIKYAKITKDHDIVKVDAFGIKFYEELSDTIEQIVNETYSYKIPISINTENEEYNYFEMFSLLNEKDMNKAIETEFELLCEERGVNRNLLESRHILVNIPENREKTNAMNISTKKADLVKPDLQKYNLKNIVPLPIAISNNIEIGVKENAAIINLEEQATITTITNGQISKVDILNEGMEHIYNKINLKENSYTKVYDILKNTTIYTAEGKNLQEEENEYLEDIMPTLYNIITEVKNNVSQNLNMIEKIYITGTGAVINNIDLYFQEYLSGIKVEILKPYFMKNASSNKTNIRDYIEVNSAISLGLQGIGEGIKQINFKNSSFQEKLKEIGSMEIGKKNTKGPKSEKKEKQKLSLQFDWKAKLDNIETSLLRGAGSLLFVVIIYLIVSITISGMTKSKKEEVEAVISDTNSQIEKITQDTATLLNKKSQYTTMIKKLEEVNEKIADKNSTKNAIPNLLSRIMYSIPKGVQIISIQNTTDKHIVIDAQSEYYDQLGIFLGTLKVKEILLNVKSGSGQKQGNNIRITIEGDMP